jgi:hypothetical protein
MTSLIISTDAPAIAGPQQGHSESDTMSFDSLPTIALPIAQLFAGALDTTL